MLDDDWKVIESLSKRTMGHAPKIKVRFSDDDLESIAVIVEKCKASNPGIRPSMGDAVRLALYWYVGENLPVYYVSLSQLIRDVVTAYAKVFAQKNYGRRI
jgi:hypothetical protein